MKILASLILGLGTVLAAPAHAQPYPNKPIRLVVPFDSLPSGLPHVKEGRLKALGITSARRSPLLPGLPADVVNRINTAVKQALQDPDVKDRLARLGIEPAGGTPQQFATMTDADRAKWKKIIDERKLLAD